MKEIKKFKTKKGKKGLNKVSLVSKDRVLTIAKFANDISKGKKTPILPIQNVDKLIAEMKKKNMPEKDRVKILQEIFFNNEKKLRKIKNAITDRKIKRQKARIARKNKRKRSAGGFKFTAKYSDAQIQKQEKVVTTTRNALSNAKNSLSKGEVDLANASKELKACTAKPLCNPRNRKSKIYPSSSIYSYHMWWVNTGIRKRKDAVNTAQKAFDTAYILLQKMLKENKDEMALQKATWEEERARQEDLRRQEQNEAKLRQAGLDEQNLKLKLAKQAAEILKIEKETVNVGLNPAPVVMGGTAMPGAFTPADDNKMLVIGGVVLVTLIGIGAIIYSKKKK